MSSKSSTEAEGPTAYGKAVDLLARREHFRRELETKLGRRGYDAGDIEQALARLEREKLLDDERAARQFTEQRLRRGPLGRRRLARDLRRKGASSAAVDAALEELPADETPAAREAAERWTAQRRGVDGSEPLDRKDQASLARYLERRGFAEGTIWGVLEEWGQG